MPSSAAEVAAEATRIIRSTGSVAADDALEMRFRYRRFLTSSSMRAGFDRRQLAAINAQHSAAMSFLDNDIREAYRQGAMFGTGEPSFTLTAVDRKYVSNLRKEGRAQVTQNFEKAKSNLRASKSIRDDIRTNEFATPGEMRQHFTHFSANGVTTGDGRTWTHSAYNELVVHTKSVQAYNRGTIEATARTGIVAWEIRDSPSCGLTQHDDPNKANGMIVNKQDAQSYMLSHPYCVRTFVPRPDITDPPTKGGLRLALGKLAKQQAALAAANVGRVGVALLHDAELRQAVAQYLLQHDLNFRGIQMRLDRFSQDLKHTLFARENVIDIRTGQPVNKFSVRDILENLLGYSDDLKQGRPVPEYVKKVMGVNERTPKKIVGDTIEQWENFYDNLQDASLSLNDLANKLALEQDGRQALFDFAGDITGGGEFGDSRFARFSLPNLGGAGRRPRLSIAPANKFFRATLSATKERGLLGNIRIFRNGIFRVGAEIEAQTRTIFPNLSFVPKGPIRIFTTLNRSEGLLVTEENFDQAIKFAAKFGINPENVKVGERVGQGVINSVSAELRIVTREKGRLLSLVKDPSVSVNLNLRKLGLGSLKDIRNLTLADFRKLGLEDLSIVSFATNMRLQGFGPLDFTRVLRVKFDAVQKLWELGAQGLSKKVLDIGSKTMTEAMEILRGERVFDTRVVKTMIKQDLEKLAPRNVIKALEKDLNETSRKIIDAFMSDKPLNEMLKVAADLQKDLYRKVFVSPREKIVEEGRNLLTAFFTNTRKVIDSDVIQSVWDDFTSSLPIEVKRVPLSIHEINGVPMTSKAFQDIFKSIELMEERYPGVPVKFRVTEMDLKSFTNEKGHLLGKWAQYNPQIADGFAHIDVDRQYVLFWDDIARKTTVEAERVWEWTERGGNPAGTFMHEMGHHLDNLLTRTERDELWRRIGAAFNESLDLSTDPKREKFIQDLFMGKWNESVKARTALHDMGVSNYSLRNPQEFIAEMFANSVMSTKPSPLGKIVGDFFDDVLGPAAELRPVDRRFSIPLGPANLPAEFARAPAPVIVDVEAAEGPITVMSTARHTLWDVKSERFWLDTDPDTMEVAFDNPDLIDKLNRGFHELERFFPHGPKMEWFFEDSSSARLGGGHAAYSLAERNIAFSRNFVDVDLEEGLIRKAIETNHFAHADLHEDYIHYVMVHEYAHAMEHDALWEPFASGHIGAAIQDVLRFAQESGVHLSQDEIELMGKDSIDAMFEMQQLSMSIGMQQFVMDNVSGYSGHNYHELIAEATAEFLLSAKPRMIANLIGQAMLEAYG